MKKVTALLLCVFGVIVTVVSIILKVKKHMSVSIIGGADGPTSIFLAGKVGGDFALSGILIGIVFIVLAVILLVWRKK